MDLDQPRFPIITEPHELDRSGFDPNDRGVKLLLFVRRARGLDVDAFHAAWMSDADLDAGRALGLTRHIVAPALPATYEFLPPNHDRLDVQGSGNGEAPFDGVRELWWASRHELERALRESSDAWRTLLHGECVEISRSLALFGRERVIAPEPGAIRPSS